MSAKLPALDRQMSVLCDEAQSFTCNRYYVMNRMERFTTQIIHLGQQETFISQLLLK